MVVDALDEADDTGLPPSANRLFLPRFLPDGVFFVITAREEANYRLDVDHVQDIWVRDDDPANRADVCRYVNAFVLAEWREFLNEDAQADPARFRIYHRSFAEFLDREEDLRYYHQRIAAAALAKIPGFDVPGPAPAG